MCRGPIHHWIHGFGLGLFSACTGRMRKPLHRWSTGAVTFLAPLILNPSMSRNGVKIEAAFHKLTLSPRKPEPKHPRPAHPAAPCQSLFARRPLIGVGGFRNCFRSEQTLSRQSHRTLSSLFFTEGAAGAMGPHTTLAQQRDPCLILWCCGVTMHSVAEIASVAIQYTIHTRSRDREGTLGHRS